MKSTGIVRRIDDLGRVVIPKEIRRTMRIREGDPSQITLTQIDRVCRAITCIYIRIQDTQSNNIPL
jgi:AbrB family looped-hinge helix DNA binding protein